MEFLLLVAIVAIIGSFSLSRGWLGELQTKIYLGIFLSSDAYIKLDNVIIPSDNGTAQIDHLLISPYGLFIVETKNMRGWIFGSANQSRWTQCIYGGKYPFLYPVSTSWTDSASLLR